MNLLLSGSILSALGVAIGAFGAHGLKALLEQNQRLETFETGVKYQMYHAIALLLIGVIKLIKPETSFNLVGVLFLAGIFIFSGSLYVLSIANIRWLGAITPIGGVCFIAGWVLLAVKAFSINS